MENPKPPGIVFPYPYQGHVTPMINLSLKLASIGFTITFVQPEFVHHSISKAHNIPPEDFDPFTGARESGLDIRYTTISDGFSMEFDRDLYFNEFWETMFRDFPARVEQVVERTISSSTMKGSSFFLIADTLYSWPSEVAKNYSMVNVSLWTEPAIVFSINYNLDLLRDNGHFPCTGNANNIINYIPGVQSINTRDLMSYIQDPNIIPILIDIVTKSFHQVKEADLILCNTVQELEPQTLAALNHNHPTYAIGPINFYTNFTIAKSLRFQSDCTNWLNSKPHGSVLYVSFGSIAQSSKQELTEFAHGLLLSEVYFIWILRDDIVEDKEVDFLPKGFQESIKDRGLIVPWCNQNEVLSSNGTGGFLTHSGWNSILESMWYGVPMICYPFLVDQFMNRKLVVDDWKIGINLCDGEEVRREEVANKIEILMKGETGGEMRQEIKKVSKKLHDSLGIEGSSQKNFDIVVDDLKDKLYGRSKNL